jgi:hypothetical protein
MVRHPLSGFELDLDSADTLLSGRNHRRGSQLRVERGDEAGDVLLQLS